MGKTVVLHGKAEVSGDLVEVGDRSWHFEAWGKFAQRFGISTGDVVELRVIDLEALRRQGDEE